jgi:uncharacterized protein
MVAMADPVDLEFLDRFLMSDNAPENGMGLSDLDGFLTGILVGPELIMPSEWLPHVWGGEAPVFETQEQAQLVVSTIMGRYNEIARALEGDPSDLDPIFWEHPDGTVLAADWAEGFHDAIGLRPKGWAALFQDKETSPLLIPILALCSDENGGDLVPLAPGMRDKMLAEAPELIPVCVFALRRFWRERESRPGIKRTSSKPGRNALCACGSGRKYKRCCGAN